MVHRGGQPEQSEQKRCPLPTPGEGRSWGSHPFGFPNSRAQCNAAGGKEGERHGGLVRARPRFLFPSEWEEHLGWRGRGRAGGVGGLENASLSRDERVGICRRIPAPRWRGGLLLEKLNISHTSPAAVAEAPAAVSPPVERGPSLCSVQGRPKEG